MGYPCMSWKRAVKHPLDNRNPNPVEGWDFRLFVLVAGAGFEPATFGL